MEKKVFIEFVVIQNSNINYYNNPLISDYQSPIKATFYQPQTNDNFVNQSIDQFEEQTPQYTTNYTNNISQKSKFEQQNQSNKSQELTPEEKKEVEKLQKTDQKVRAHEQAHLAAGAGLVRGGASYEYTRGPDGKMYVVGGEVKIDISPVPGKPQETIRKMEKVVAAALAPVDPSPQDRAVATMARNIQAKAQMEKAEEDRKKLNNKSQSTDENSNNTVVGINNASNKETNPIDNSNISNNTNNANQIGKRIIKPYIVNNPYQNLDRILYKLA